MRVEDEVNDEKSRREVLHDNDIEQRKTNNSEQQLETPLDPATPMRRLGHGPPLCRDPWGLLQALGPIHAVRIPGSRSSGASLVSRGIPCLKNKRRPQDSELSKGILRYAMILGVEPLTLSFCGSNRRVLTVHASAAGWLKPCRLRALGLELSDGAGAPPGRLRGGAGHEGAGRRSPKPPRGIR